MDNQRVPRGWQLHHHEHLFIRANNGAPTIRLKFFHYPSYRQTVIINQPPTGCKLKNKRDNTFFFFQQKVRMKAIISLERIISIYPTPSTISPHASWGRISDIPRTLQRKYTQSFTYWPVDSPAIQDISQETWFSTDDLNSWVHAAYTYITMKIKYPENQDKRLGADQALRTGTGDCEEFTDLFITLARIRGVPCRRLTGYFIHYANNEAEPHAWAEIQSPTLGWIPIDIALRNIGKHTINYVIGKIEEFIPTLLDYQILRQTTAVHYHWERPAPLITPQY
jgi:hypothetical protein